MTLLKGVPDWIVWLGGIAAVAGAGVGYYVVVVQGTAVTKAIEPDGFYTDTGFFFVGSDIQVSTVVNALSMPTAIEVFVDGISGDKRNWPASTGNNYITDYGPATTAQVGSHTVYAKVTFADGVVATSNQITIGVQPVSPISG